MKNIICSIALVTASMSFTACNDWLDLLPNNEQVTDKYWQSKEDVEAVIASGYYYMRAEDVLSRTLGWGELRGGSLYSANGDLYKIQNFTLLPEDRYADYASLYKVINMANSVIWYAPSVQSKDKTYYDALMQSHLCEAYFMRAYMYSLLVKNYKEVPLITKAYVNDAISFDIAKSSEAEIIAQIKEDIKTALATNAAKSKYETDWQTKGRVTKWALYALMADICLYNHDYDECIEYADMILDAKEAFRPAFITSTNKWFEIFYPGNSNESIFELNWDYNNYGESNKFSTWFGLSGTPTFIITDGAMQAMQAETTEAINLGASKEGRVGRMLMNTYVCGNSAETYNKYETATRYYLWKYQGTDIEDVANVRTKSDANFIIYRVAEIILMKAEALVMKGQYAEAVTLINKIRERAGISTLDPNGDYDQLGLLTEILNQREMEFMGEGKRWYDVLRLARYNGRPEATPGIDYKQIAISIITERNITTADLLIETALADDYAWFLPLPKSDMETNKLLEQNPYYLNAK